MYWCRPLRFSGRTLRRKVPSDLFIRVIRRLETEPRGGRTAPASISRPQMRRAPLGVLRLLRDPPLGVEQRAPCRCEVHTRKGVNGLRALPGRHYAIHGAQMRSTGLLLLLVLLVVLR